MKANFDLHLPSIGIGVLGGFALTALPIASLGLFDYSSVETSVLALVCAAALGGLAMLVVTPPHRSISSARDRARDVLRERFPAAPPREITWDDVPPSLSADKWLVENRDVASELTRQVVAPVATEVRDSLLLALEYAAALRSAAPVIELAKRRWAAELSGVPFDLLAYRGALQKAHPKVVLRDHGGSDDGPFDVIRILRALERARKQLSLPPADLLWLRRGDRRLWYAIDNLGRSTFHVEGLGPMAHLRAEDEAGSPLREANVESAVEALGKIAEESER